MANTFSGEGRSNLSGLGFQAYGASAAESR